MARKFLYLVAILIVLVIVALLVLRIWSKQLTELAFVPRGAFEQQAPLGPQAYDDPKMWLARPGMGPSDPSQWVPQDWTQPAAPQSRAAVFFVEPTSYFAREHWNEPLSDGESRRRAAMFVRAMASPFNRSVEIWAPRYRQATFGAFLTGDPDAQRAIDLAYGDVLKAFDYFIASTPKGTPLILAGHSQGALHLMRLLKDRVAGTPLASRVIATYMIGWPVSEVHDLPAMGLPACATPDQAGCVISWESFAEPADPSSVLDAYARTPGLDGKPRGGTPILCSNPLTGGTGGNAPASANLGTLVPNKELTGGKIVPHMAGAACSSDGMLLIGPPPDLGSYVMPGNNYHFYDIPLFWANLRADAARREAAWWKAH